MAIPGPDSHAYRICKYLFENGPQTQESIVERFPGQGLKASQPFYYTRHLGHIFKGDDNRFHLQPYMRAHFGEDIEQPTRAGIFAKPLNPKHIPSTMGMRDGSNDYKAWPSRFA